MGGKVNYGNSGKPAEGRREMKFDGDRSVTFPGMITVTKKIEKYIRKEHGGRVDGAYGKGEI